MCCVSRSLTIHCVIHMHLINDAMYQEERMHLTNNMCLTMVSCYNVSSWNTPYSTSLWCCNGVRHRHALALTQQEREFKLTSVTMILWLSLSYTLTVMAYSLPASSTQLLPGKIENPTKRSLEILQTWTQLGISMCIMYGVLYQCTCTFYIYPVRMRKG